MRRLDRRIKLILLAILLIFVVLAFLSVRNRPHNLKLSTSLMHNLQYASMAKKGTLNYFSGSTFNSVNLADYSTTPLTRVMSLPTIIQVRWTSNGALFEASGYSNQDELLPTLAANSLSTDKSYWWSIDWGQTTKPKLIGLDGLGRGGTVVDAIWSPANDIVYAIKYPNGSSASFRQGIDGLNDVQTASIGSVSNLLWVDANKTIVTNYNDRQLSVAVYNTSGKQLFNDKVVGNPDVSDDGRYLAYNFFNSKYPSTELGLGDLYVRDLSTGNNRLVQHNFSGNVHFNQDDTLVAHQITGKKDNATDMLLTFSKDGKNNKYQTKGLPYSFRPISLSVVDNKPLLYGVDETMNLYALASNVVVNPKRQDEIPFTQSVWQNNFSIQYKAVSKRYVITILSGPYESSRQAAITYIQNQGLDYNQLNITWQASPVIIHFSP